MAGMLCYYNYHVCDQRVKTVGRVHTHMGDANRHIEMMLLKHTWQQHRNMPTIKKTDLEPIQKILAHIIKDREHDRYRNARNASTITRTQSRRPTTSFCKVNS